MLADAHGLSARHEVPRNRIVIIKGYITPTLLLLFLCQHTAVLQPLDGGYPFLQLSVFILLSDSIPARLLSVPLVD